jgi:hypothetical protein
MGSGRDSHDLLSHFDRPKVVCCPDFDWDENSVGPGGFEFAAIESDLIQRSGAPLSDEAPSPARRDALWVLKWAAAVVVIVMAAGILVEFGASLAAERALRRAAEAGIVEATLPRATSQSVLSTIERRLPKHSIDPRKLNFTLLDNGNSVTGRVQAREGDRLSVILSANVSSPVSNWFNKNSRAPLTVRTEREVPGRRLKPKRAANN